MFRYWWVDSIAKQTMMLLDKSGLRKKGTIPTHPDKIKDEPTKEELDSLLTMFGFTNAVNSNQ